MNKNFEKLLRDYELHCQRIEQSSFVNIHEKHTDKIARIKALEADYIRWFEYYFPMYASVPCAVFHREMADCIVKNPISNTLLEIYRSGAKSVHADMGARVPFIFLHFVKNTCE